MKRKIAYLLSFIIYRILLDIIYREQISPIYAYEKFIDSPTDDSRIISWIFMGLITPIAIKAINCEKIVISLASLFMMFICVIPLTSFLQFSPQGYDFIILNFIYWWLLFYAMIKMRVKPIREAKNANFLIVVISVVVIASVIIVSGVYAGFRINLSLENVYDLRMEARTFNMPLLLKYTHAAAGNVLPLLMMYFIFRKNKVMIYVIAFIGLMEFSIAGQKSAIFKIAFCLLLSFWKINDYKKIIIPMFLTLCVGAIVDNHINSFPTIANLVIRRVMYMPQMLHTIFYDYIMNHGPIFFAPKAFGHLNFTIGDIYFGHPQMNANNGMFTDAIVNLGWAGCVIFPMILGFFFNLCQSAFKGKNRGIIFYTTLIAVTTFMSTAFTTSLLTHAVAATCLMVYLMPNDKTNK